MQIDGTLILLYFKESTNRPCTVSDLVGGVDSQGGYVSNILCVETKESGPLAGCAGHAPQMRQ